MKLSQQLKRPLREAYFRASLLAARTMIRGQTGARRFDRVAVVAAMGGRNGITNGAALQAAALDSVGCDTQLVDATSAMGKPFKRIPHRPASTYVFHSGGPETSNLVLAVLPHAARARRIAYWAWELPMPPKRWPDLDGVYSEIWTPSEFAKQSLSQRYRSVPINVVAHRIAPRPPRNRRPDMPFTVLAMGDSRSSFARKNVGGAVAAFVAAFGTSKDARLIVKVNGKAGQTNNVPNEWRCLPNVTVVDSYLEEAQLEAIYSNSDVFLSLHRAEGFGLPMIEAMARKIPVVATGWSGNLQFMNTDNSILIPFRLIPCCDEFTYSRYFDAEWADPNIEAAASALKRLRTDSGYYEQIACSARSSAEALFDDWRLPADVSKGHAEPVTESNSLTAGLSLEGV
jgi:glycosyltransferase involved in cell wall biosynthesis